MRIDGIRSTALRPGRPGRGWRASSAAEVAEDAVVETRRSAIEGDFQPQPTAIRHAAAVQAPSTRVLQALESYSRIAALVAEPGEYLDVYV